MHGKVLNIYIPLGRPASNLSLELQVLPRKATVFKPQFLIHLRGSKIINNVNKNSHLFKPGPVLRRKEDVKVTTAMAETGSLLLEIPHPTEAPLKNYPGRRAGGN